MNTDFLAEKLALMSLRPELAAAAVTAFGTALADETAHLTHVNPLSFAAAHALDPVLTVDHFVHAAKAGLFELGWDLFCPVCGVMAINQASINAVSGEMFHCAVCDVDIPIRLDDNIEVYFTANPDFREGLPAQASDALGPLERFLSPNMTIAESVRGYFAEHTEAALSLAPGAAGDMAFVVRHGTVYRLVNFETHSSVNLSGENSGASALDLTLGETGFPGGKLPVAPGQFHLKVTNATGMNVDVMAVRLDPERLRGLFFTNTPRFRPFLSGKTLLNTQSFRDQFRISNLIPDLKLTVRSLTILFTDLKGSTELYERVGDLSAYKLVQDHFKLLREAVGAHSGAIVKSMGDAIMATFSTPKAGVLAALDMMRAMRELSRTLGANTPVKLKIGLHEGPSLTVNADGLLDYFGQTVNIAARIQGLAGPDEIWTGESVLASPEVADVLTQSGYSVEARQASLKGVAQSQPVYRCRKN